MSEETKNCPMCGEEIKADAIKCRFCGSPIGIAGNNIPDRNSCCKMPQGSALADFCSFKIMILPFIIKLGFWVGVVVILFVALWKFADKEVLSGLGLFFFGILGLRLFCEMQLLLFSLLDVQRESRNIFREIRDNICKK